MFNKDRYIVKKFKTISDLEKEKKKTKDDIVNKRKKIKICVLDDEGFDASELNKLGYINIDSRIAFEKIDDFKQYNLVLCDVDGIGNGLDQKKQGLAVADNIVTAYYPNTQVVIFTGKELSNYDYDGNPNVKVIRKNMSSYDLAKELDAICSVFWNPVNSWGALEKYFRENKLSNLEITIMEDIFVESINLKDEDYILKRNKKLKFDSEVFANAVVTGAKILKTILKVYHESSN